ncbi:hypothetical protein N425_12460 [Tannerella sp. oral taxon BU063 isolate Cell 2]|uniref:DUF3256 domain-containing protein n=1 Tax=Tannerella sp. oral taxon BU063 isolate Cell 2 TaxID=1411148 RepID=W2C3B4_9BACT|nr:hypothetical protein N425_12460 [Tannerella sp. oral taxon BU063 isolate Cell 2]
MRKRWIAMVLAAAMSAAAQAQDVAELFLKMPDTQLVLLNEASRKTLVDMHRAGEKAIVNNEMGGMAEIWKMTDDYLWLETSMGNFIQIRRLPLVNHTYVICLITSVGIVRQGQDSRVEFFTTDWTPLPTEGMYRPATMRDFLRADADTTSEDFKEICAAADIDLFHYKLSPDDLTMSVRYNTPKYFDQALQEKANRFFIDGWKVYTWRNGRFEESGVTAK